MVDECMHETQTMQDEDEEMAAALDDEEGDGMRLASTALEANTGGVLGSCLSGIMGAGDWTGLHHRGEECIAWNLMLTSCRPTQPVPALLCLQPPMTRPAS